MNRAQALGLGQAQSDAAMWQRDKAALEKGWAESSKKLEAEIVRLRDHVAKLEHHSRWGGSHVLISVVLLMCLRVWM